MSPQRRYPLWLGGIIVGMLALSAVVMYLLLGDATPAVSIQDVTGTPAPVTTGVATGTGDIRPTETGAIASSAMSDSLRELARKPAAPRPSATDSTGASPGAVPAQPSPVTAQVSPPQEAPASSRPDRPAKTAQPAPQPRPTRSAWDEGLDQARAAVGRSDWPAALRLYDGLLRERPTSRTVAIERARVLTWSGDPAAGAEAAADVLRQGGADASLQLDRARWLWWAGRLWDADSAVAAVLAETPDNVDARTLQVQVREGLQPTVHQARAWLAQRDEPLERLWLARAYVRGNDDAGSLEHYRAATGSGLFADSVLLEYASAAVTADSPAAAVSALGGYSARHPQDREVAIRHARALTWAGRNDRAIEAYTGLLIVQEDPGLRYDRAAVYVAENRLDLASADLSKVVAAEPKNVSALMLLGDIARWQGEWSDALQDYRRVQAVAPQTDGLATGVREAERMLALASAAPDTARRAGGSWSVETEAFGDSEDFRWLEAAARRSWAFDGYGLELRLRQDMAQGDEAGVQGPRTAGYGAEAGARVAAGTHVWLLGSVGFRSFVDVGSFATWIAGLRYFDLKTTRVALEYQHGPAVRRASTAASLEARVRSDLLSATAERRMGAWTASVATEYEHLASDLGTTQKYGGSFTLVRPVSGGLSASLGVSGLAASGASPLLPGYGNLYWAPKCYVAPTAGLRYDARLGGAWSAAVRMNPSYVFVQERGGTEQRFFSDHLFYLGSGMDLTYVQPNWQLGISADWSGATFETGYRAGALRIRFVTLPDWP